MKFFRTGRAIPRHLVASTLLISTLLTSCTVGTAPPATLSANIPGVVDNTSGSAPNLYDATATPIRHTLPRDSDLVQLMNTVQSDQLMVTISALAAMQTRHILSDNFDPSHGIGITAARDYLLGQFRAMQGKIPLQIWTQPVTVTLNKVVSTSDNIIARLQGSDPAARTIVIGAHYDTENVLDPYSADLVAPGADDNASGVAALLAIAQAMIESPPRATVLFVAFTAEESGLQGSTAFINAYLNTSQPPIVPRAMLNLDTLGDAGQSGKTPVPAAIRLFSADPDSSPSRQLARWLALTASAYPELPALIIQSQAERNGRIGDQQAFSAAAIPAVHVIEASSAVDNQRSASDTISTIAPDYLVTVTRAALIMSISLADGPDAPTHLTWQSDTSTLSWTPQPGVAGYILRLRTISASNTDQTIVLNNQGSFNWNALHNYDSAMLCAFDAQGRIGMPAMEISLR